MISPGSIYTISAFNQQNWNAVLKKEFGTKNIQSCEYDQSIPTLSQLIPGKADLGIYWITKRDVEWALVSKMDLVERIFNLSGIFKFSIVILPVVESLTTYSNEVKNEIYRLHFELNGKYDSSRMAIIDPTFSMLNNSHAISSSLWYLSKTPYHKNVFTQVGAYCHSIWNAWHGLSKKVLIVDLDDTIWGGIVGDDGWENLKIGGHDPVGEAYADVQQWVLNLKNQGVVLAICSKNDERNVWEAFEKNLGMILKKSDFAAWRINWNDKAANISELVKELNVGMDSVVFIDDNPAERNRIQLSLPEIFVPDLPADKLLFPSFLESLHCFIKLNLTNEDLRRTEWYQQESERKNNQSQFSSIDEWIASLNIEIRFEPLNDANLMRAEQLLNKTNQMNLRTRRMTREELKSWASEPNHWFYVVYVKDVFGDNGITGLIGFHKTGNEIFVDDFVMSCRIMGRKVEDEMLNFILSKAGEFQVPIIAHYLPTEKNVPVKDFFERISKTTDKLQYLS